MSTFNSLKDLEPIVLGDGLAARAINGERMTMAVVDLEPNVAVPEHRHVNEQAGFVARGSITMTVGGESQDLAVGETYVIATDVPHAALAGPDGATVVDIFSPPRSDWEGLERLEPSRAAWP